MASLYVVYLTIAAFAGSFSSDTEVRGMKQIETFGWCLEAQEVVGIPIAMPSS